MPNKTITPTVPTQTQEQQAIAQKARNSHYAKMRRVAKKLSEVKDSHWNKTERQHIRFVAEKDILAYKQRKDIIYNPLYAEVEWLPEWLADNLSADLPVEYLPKRKQKMQSCQNGDSATAQSTETNENSQIDTIEQRDNDSPVAEDVSSMAGQEDVTNCDDCTHIDFDEIFNTKSKGDSSDDLVVGKTVMLNSTPNENDDDDLATKYRELNSMRLDTSRPLAYKASLP